MRRRAQIIRTVNELKFHVCFDIERPLFYPVCPGCGCEPVAFLCDVTKGQCHEQYQARLLNVHFSLSRTLSCLVWGGLQNSLFNLWTKYLFPPQRFRIFGCHDKSFKTSPLKFEL